MGVSIYPGEASWSYGGFGRFRERLAAEEGFDLGQMRGFCNEFEAHRTEAEHTCADRSWDGIHSTLKPLLNHSDCDGYLSSWECEEMLMRLRAIADQWTARIESEHPGCALEYDYDLHQLRALIKGMQHCVAHRCAMEFA